jgi:hypothetical protein
VSGSHSLLFVRFFLCAVGRLPIPHLSPLPLRKGEADWNLVEQRLGPALGAEPDLMVGGFVSQHSPLSGFGERGYLPRRGGAKAGGEGTSFWLSQIAIRCVIGFEWIASLESRPNTAVY